MGHPTGDARFDRLGLLVKKTIAECAELAGTHIATAFSAILSGSHHPGYRPLSSGGVLLITGIDHPMGNMLCGPSNAEIEEGLAALIECEKPSMATFTSARPSPNESLVGPLGFQFYPPTPAMAIDLDLLAETSLPDGYSYRRLEPSDSRAGWAQAASAGFQIPLEFCNLMCPESSKTQNETVHFFVVEQGDLVVAVSSMICSDGVAGIYCVATLPSHRGRGLGAHVTAEPLRLAHEMGYQIGVLQASKAGYPVYQRLGFETVGSIRMATRMPS